MLKLVLYAMLFLSSSFVFSASPSKSNAKEFYSMWGTHNKKSPIYKLGEEMIFTVKVLKDDKPVEGITLKWTRTGDDGVTKQGECLSAKDGIKIKTSMKKPGFVRIYVIAVDENGKRIEGKKTRYYKYIVFDGGACVEPETLKGLPEPRDFDEYWKKQKELLASVPLKILEMKEVEGNNKVKAYDVKIACAGKMPVSGYLVIPKNAKPKSLIAEVSFRGYGVSGASKKLSAGANKIYFQINAHGIKNGKSKEYYKNLSKTTLKRYAFSVKENSNPDSSYFRDMFLRTMRALEFVKSLPEWNGKDLRVTGGSQGGLQSLAAAGLDPDVSYCYAWSPWCCDFGRTELKRIVGGWYVKYTPALNYFDPVNLVKRANPKCKLFIIANLGDYVCPPSGVWIVYNNFPGPKSMEIRQGCEHGYRMKNYPKYKISSKGKLKTH
jgi:cephalosporin-C deacetylase-like acetyl esterase